MPWVNEDYKERMEQEIMQEEIEQAIDNLRGENTPGMDGFSGELYKRFKVHISGRLRNLFRACFSLGKVSLIVGIN